MCYFSQKTLLDLQEVMHTQFSSNSTKLAHGKASLVSLTNEIKKQQKKWAVDLMWYQAQDFSGLQHSSKLCRNAECRQPCLSSLPVAGRSYLSAVSLCHVEGMNCTPEHLVLSPWVSRSFFVVHKHLGDDWS